MAIIVGILAQVTLAHTFAYVQGFFLLRRQGIPLRVIMSGEQTPLRILTACLVILRQNQNGINKKRRYDKFYQIISYASILMMYIASVGLGAYAASKLGAPYVFYRAPIKWRQVPVGELNQNTLERAFTPKNFGIGVNVQFNSLSNWVIKTRGGSHEVAFLPPKWTTSGAAIKNAVKWKLELQLNNINMRYLAAQCNGDPNPPCNGTETTVVWTAGKENKTISWQICNLPIDKGSMRLDCSIILKEGTFPYIIIEYPNFELSYEHLTEVMLRKN